MDLGYPGGVRQSERLSETLNRLAETGTVSVEELSADFEVSAATVRRDLDLLAQQHLAERSHGGAVARAGLYELPLRYKGVRHRPAKQLIATEAARSVVPGLAIGLTGGTTTTEVGRKLAECPSLTVVTNALNIAAELAVRTNVKLIVTGGACRPESYELVGPLAEETLAGLNLDACFVGVDGLMAEYGLTTHHEVEAHANRAMLARARRVVVVTDGSKVGRRAFARICPIGCVDEVITDDSAPEDGIEAMRQAGVAVTVLGALETAEQAALLARPEAV